MNLVFWISLGIFIVSTVLYFVFYKTNLFKPRKVFAFLLCPLLATVSISSLWNFIPDSKHIIFITVISFLFCTASIILFFYDSDVKFRIVGRTSYLISVFSWFLLYKSTFYIYKVPALLSIICTVIYISIFVITCILLGKQTLSHHCWSFLSLLTCSILHFCSVVTLIAAHNTYSLILILGTTTTYALVVYYLSQYKKEPHKHTKLIEFCMLLGSQLLIVTANYLMLS